MQAEYRSIPYSELFYSNHFFLYRLLAKKPLSGYEDTKARCLFIGDECEHTLDIKHNRKAEGQTIWLVGKHILSSFIFSFGFHYA